MEIRLAANPIQQFSRWYKEAQRQATMADAMCLSTINAKGAPSARMVLLKGVNTKGFTFFTNIHSAKAKELLSKPRAALTFHWQPLKRQVRIEGKVVRVSKKEADAYFATRPRLSQIGAWASQQSQSLASRKVLVDRFNLFVKQFEGKKVPAPDYWQGFCVVPNRIEFWQEGPNRLHDRWVYSLTAGQRWRTTRLYP